MEKSCPRHGAFRTVVWRGKLPFSLWTADAAALTGDEGSRCPENCGLCGEHRRRSCCVLLEVTKRCNLRCRFCFADAGAGDDPPRDSLLEAIGDIAERCARPMLQLSGEIEEAAIIMGVPWWKRMTRVLFPIQKSSFISGYLLPFISCMREMSLFVLLAASYTTLVTTLLQEYSRTGLSQSSNAINLLIIIFVLVIQFAVNKLTGASIDKGVGG